MRLAVVALLAACARPPALPADSPNELPADRTRQYTIVVLPMLLLAAAGAVAGGRTLGRRDGAWWFCVAAIAVNMVAVACFFPMARLSTHVYAEVAWLAAGGCAVLLRRR